MGQVVVIPDDGPPTWVVRKFEYLARQAGMSYYDWVELYNPSFDPTDWDNDPGSPEQAWA